MFYDKMVVCFCKVWFKRYCWQMYNLTATTEAFGPECFGTPDFLLCSVKTNFQNKKAGLYYEHLKDCNVEWYNQIKKKILLAFWM